MDQPQPEPIEVGKVVTLQASGISIKFDLTELLTAINPEGRYIGYDPEEDEPRFVPASFVDLIVEAAAEHLTKVARAEVVKQVRSKVEGTVAEEVAEIVRATLSEEFQPMTAWGGVNGSPTTLKKMVVDAAADMAKPQRDYGRQQPSALQKMVAEEVGRTFKGELSKVVEEHRAAARKAVQDSAAEVIRETIERATRGI